MADDATSSPISDRPHFGGLRLLLVAVVAAAAASLVAGPIAHGDYRYNPAGRYLDYGQRASLLDGLQPFDSFEIAPHGGGIVEIAPDGKRYSASTDDAVYGLWYFSHYVQTGDRADLHQAQRAAHWLRLKQDPRTGVYPVLYSYDLGGREDGSDHIVLNPPWFGANSQALPISLLSRLFLATGNPRYRAQAALALRPLAKPVGAGGVQAPFFDTGHVFFEGYSTLATPVHTLSHLVQTLVGLYDASSFSALARRLYKEGSSTLPVALPYYDLADQGRTAAWLAHITDPPRPVYTLIGFFQEALVAELRALDSVTPNPVVSHYASAWAAQLPAICADPGEYCVFH